eukprot:SAG31_NODE_28359_length_411_cov_0.884615_1_plen_70_part_00
MKGGALPGVVKGATKAATAISSAGDPLGGGDSKANGAEPSDEDLEAGLRQGQQQSDRDGGDGSDVSDSE